MVGVPIAVIGAIALFLLGSVFGAISTYARGLIYRWSTGRPVPGIDPALFAGAFRQRAASATDRAEKNSLHRVDDQGQVVHASSDGLTIANRVHTRPACRVGVTNADLLVEQPALHRGVVLRVPADALEDEDRQVGLDEQPQVRRAPG